MTLPFLGAILALVTLFSEEKKDSITKKSWRKVNK